MQGPRGTVKRWLRRRPTPARDSPDGRIELGFSERGASERGHQNQIKEEGEVDHDVEAKTPSHRHRRGPGAVGEKQR
jgi:hypothetical protein